MMKKSKLYSGTKKLEESLSRAIKQSENGKGRPHEEVIHFLRKKYQN